MSFENVDGRTMLNSLADNSLAITAKGGELEDPPPAEDPSKEYHHPQDDLPGKGGGDWNHVPAQDQSIDYRKNELPGKGGGDWR